jgi:hypothetical protein
MNGKGVGPIAWRILLLAGVVTVLGAAQRENVKALYSDMAPLDQYLIPDRQTEISLARSAAPAAISDQATIFVLTPHGYDTAI